jgi:predicted O-methyltransferase YrrM
LKSTLFYDNVRAFSRLLRDPIGATRYLLIFLREVAVDKTSKIGHLLNVPSDTVTNILNELEKPDLNVATKTRIAAQRGLPIGGMTTAGRGPVVYAICRLLKPKAVVETGVASGVSSTYILHALQKNGRGTLYSIDYPTPGDKLPTGWLVPEEVRNRWRLIRGKSSEKLQDLLNDLLEVDLFLHDSEHSYQNMMFEFETVWPHLRKEGVLLSDDTHMNESFFDFARSVNKKPVRFYLLAAIRK